MTLAQKIHWKIVNRKPEDMEELLSEIVKERPAVEVLNNVLLPAMKEVGEKFGSGELILPFVLQSAETMKRAVAYLEQYLDKSASASKGTIVLATVLGDVHDIGKNLVKTILSNNGFLVHDLGKQVTVATIVEKAKEVKADAIGLSALLVSTSKQMPLCVQELSRQGLEFPVVVGGAAINQRYGQRISFVDGDKFYEPGVYYARDAFDGLSILNNLADPTIRKGFQGKQKQSAVDAKSRNFSDPLPDAPGTLNAASSDVKPAPSFPKNPFHGTAVIQPVPLRDVWPLLDLNSLYKLNWGIKGSHEEYQKLIKERFEPMRFKMQEEALSLGIFEPKVVYGYWWAASEGNILHVYDEQEAKTPFESFRFPRQKVGRHLCLADYFKPMGSGEKDVVAFQLATVGQKAADHIEKLNKSDRYSEGLFWHGLAVQTAEALAQWTQKRILKEWNLPETRGKRYSPGFPACPEMSDQAKVFHLLDATKNLGVKLTEAFMMVPEQSTSAIVVHHPDAEYFNVR
jgi:5-methyltetrahydrofolate--homocysteine methyltransferase